LHSWRIQCATLAAAQAVLKATSHLSHLTLDGDLDGQGVQVLAAAPLPSLHSLDIRSIDVCTAHFLTGYTQLKELSLGCVKVKGVTALTQLTALTSLRLSTTESHPKQHIGRLLSPMEQFELGSVLAALQELRSLYITCLPPGPMTDAVSQLTALTQVTLVDQHLVGNPGPLILRSVLSLRLCDYNVTPNHLAQIHAPQLQHLAAALAPKPDELDTLRGLCRGALKAANTLTLNLKNSWSKEETVALMAVLHQSWQPSTQALSQPDDDSWQLQHDICSGSTPREWRLELWKARCSRQCLSFIPNGLRRLHLM
jgi:hypothetical protein